MWCINDEDDDAAEFAAIPDARELWRLLVARRGGPELPPAVAVEVFRRIHGAGEPGSGDSALLLCTDWRWRRTSAKVLTGILDTAILDNPDEDALAEKLLWQDKVRYNHPLGWIGATFIEFEFGSTNRSSTARQRKVRVDPNTPMTTERDVWPPLRAWAAEHLLTRRQTLPANVQERARSLPAHDGAAVMTGAARAAEQLDPEQARMVVDVALQWGHKTPRRAALERLIATGESDRALIIAADDPDGSIRAWARRLRAGNASQDSLFG